MHARRRKCGGLAKRLTALVLAAAALQALRRFHFRVASAPGAAALELSGELRTFAKVLPSWEAHLFPQLLQAFAYFDVYAVCVNAEEASTARTLLSKAGARTVTVAVRQALPQAWTPTPLNIPLFDPTLLIPLFDPTPKLWLIRAAPGHEPKSAKGWLFQLLGIEAASELRLQTSAQRLRGAQHGGWHAAVFRCRFDVEFLKPLPSLESFDFASNAIVVPSIQRHGGWNDKFAFGGPASMRAYAGMLQAVSKAALDAESLRAFGCPAADLTIQAEVCLAWHLADQHITVQQADIDVRILRVDGSHSETRRRR
ncbi:hypothetical protein M885DRAFT_151376 [Pelagophyceae sp. CCMP2097]|nr:hypothetical protein M885DRAFT_151376 [Pelagophyceae sp. CCMP2097]